MPFAMKLDGYDCPHCGEDELYWWAKDETETTEELYMTCYGCDYEFPKIFVSKTDDTSDKAMKRRLISRYL